MGLSVNDVKDFEFKSDCRNFYNADDIVSEMVFSQKIYKQFFSDDPTLNLRIHQ